MPRFLSCAGLALTAFCAASVPTFARAAVTPDQLRRHIAVLASDAFEGRKPGTAGETRSLSYIASQLQAAGLAPAAADGGWYQPVRLIERKAFAHRALWSLAGSPVAIGQNDLVLVGDGPSEAVLDAPVLFAGYGAEAGTDVGGAVVLLLYATPEPGGADYETRAEALVERGAAAVVAVFDDEASWPAVAASFAEKTRIADAKVARISGAISGAAVERLLGGPLSASVRPRRLAVRASLEVSTEVRAYDSHNVIGRLRGTDGSQESLLILGHWDHLGLCRPEGAADRICNGAVDNASGIAMLIEAARLLARGKRPRRDILFLATTAEEMGLLGATWFSAHPVVPLASIVAAVNLDTVAVAPRGEPVATIGRGVAGIDALIAETARGLGRRLDSDGEADVLVTRQDGWALSRAGVPTVMVGGSFSDMARLRAFLAGPYHKPEDGPGANLVLDGAAEDSDLLVALVRKLADPARYQAAPGR